MKVRFERIELMLEQHHQSVERPKKILVPGKGIFTTPQAKRRPKVMTDEEQWVKEQDER